MTLNYINSIRISCFYSRFTGLASIEGLIKSVKIVSDKRKVYMINNSFFFFSSGEIYDTHYYTGSASTHI